ncbi:RNI-like protein [Coprinopsis marcescibilis]|uniref:RNI-like protein n=1 Tax=Coprinopsis marcescibilis TaxID=230819 RepID=A0A5C3KPD1_COPMA|nr:RNI-like protein [Coprinopsis marcescibilis]
MLYRHFAPSNTSLSDDYDDDEPAQTNFFNSDQPLFDLDAAVQPHWSAKTPTLPTKGSMKATLKSPISNLPPEIVIYILKHVHASRDLLSALRVSRTWCECAVELLWHKPAFTRYSTLEKMSKLLKRSRQTFPYARFIRRLNFLAIGSELRDDTLSVFNRCVRLERLTLTGCKMVTPKSLEQVLTCFPNIVAVDLTGVVETTTEVVSAFASVAKRLQGINLTNCNKVGDPALIALGENCPMLRRVKLSGATLVTDAGVSAIVQNCPLLLELDLHQCELITDIAIRDVWLYSNHMRELRLSHCPALTDLAFPSVNSAVNPFPNADPNALPLLYVNRTFEQLRLLDLTNCSQITDDAVEGIIAHAPKIRNLVLSKCGFLTDRSVDAICSLGKHLHYLHLGHASRITDASVKSLARSCTRIRYIDFANCVKLTDMSVFELSALPKLRRIGLVRVTNLTDEAVYSLAERHATLERIHLSYCDQISVMAVHFLLLKLHKLTHLSLSGVPAFRQRELQTFCREAPRDFNTAQRQNFCVFSGKGVSQLRTFLTQLFDTITEQNATDDTEYEDDDFPEPFHPAATPEPEAADVDEEITPFHVINPNNVTINRGSRWALTPRAYELALQREQNRRTQRENPTAPPPIVTVPEGLTLPGTIQGAANSTVDRRDQPGRGRGAVADMLPIVESPVTTPAGVSGESEPGSSGTGFFQIFQEPISPIGNGAMTPDLNFAEIGHGRGTTNRTTTRLPNAGHAARIRPDAQAPPPAVQFDSAAVAAALQQEIEPGSSRARSEQATSVGLTIENPSWDLQRRRQANDPTIRDLEASVHSALNTGRASRARVSGRMRDRLNTGGNGSSSRGRSVRRTLRNGLSAAENIASTLLFGRNLPEEGASSSQTASSSSASPRPHHSQPQSEPQPDATGSSNAHWFGSR